MPARKGSVEQPEMDSFTYFAVDYRRVDKPETDELEPSERADGSVAPQYIYIYNQV